MAKANKNKQHQKKIKNKPKSKSADSAKFRVEKVKGNKNKRERSVAYAKHEKKRIQNQQFESIQNLNTKLDQMQASIRNPNSENFERLKAPNNPVDISQAIDAISSL